MTRVWAFSSNWLSFSFQKASHPRVSLQPYSTGYGVDASTGELYINMPISLIFVHKSLPSISICLSECLPQFIDLCILLGCDYCGTIKGIGPKRAIDLIKQHGSIEEILENIDPNVSLFALFKCINSVEERLFYVFKMLN